MRVPALLLAALAGLSPLAPVRAEEGSVEIGHVNTAITNLGLTRSHRVVIDRFEDPKVANVSCYIAQARTGGISGTIGVAEDPARFDLSCAASGPVQVQPSARRGDRGEQMYESATSLFFKETRVHRFIDEQRQAVVYLAWSTKLVNGSPYSSVAVVPIR